MNDTEKAHQFITVRDIASGKLKGYAHNLANLTDKCSTGKYDHAVYFEEALKRIIRKCECTMRDVSQNERVIREFKIGKSYVCKKTSSFLPTDPTTWKLSGGFTSRWQSYKNEGYHGLVVLACIDGNAIHSTYDRKVDCQLYTLALEQSLINHYLFVDQNEKLANESIDCGNKWKDEGDSDDKGSKRGVVYIALRFDEFASEDCHEDTADGTKSPTRNVLKNKETNVSSQPKKLDDDDERVSPQTSDSQDENQGRKKDNEDGLPDQKNTCSQQVTAVLSVGDITKKRVTNEESSGKFNKECTEEEKCALEDNHSLKNMLFSQDEASSSKTDNCIIAQNVEQSSSSEDFVRGDQGLKYQSADLHTQTRYPCKPEKPDECFICGHDGGRSKQCFLCGKNYHLECYVPKLESIPQESAWVCLLCEKVDPITDDAPEILEKSSGKQLRRHRSETGLSTKETKVGQRILLELFCHDAYIALRDASNQRKGKGKISDFKKLTDKLSKLRSRLKPKNSDHFQAIKLFFDELQRIFCSSNYEEISRDFMVRLKDTAMDLIKQYTTRGSKSRKRKPDASRDTDKANEKRKRVESPITVSSDDENS